SCETRNECTTRGRGAAEPPGRDAERRMRDAARLDKGLAKVRRRSRARKGDPAAVPPGEGSNARRFRRNLLGADERGNPGARPPPPRMPDRPAVRADDGR